MDNELIIKTKEKLEMLIKERDKISKLLFELEKLKETDSVKRYLELCSYNTESNIKLALCSDDDLIMKSWDEYKYLNKNTYEIYIYVGTYINGYEEDVLTYYNDPNANYRCFMNIENEFDIRNVDIAFCDAFIKNNNVIIPKNDIFASREYWVLRREFFVDLIKYKEDMAVNKILKKCERN